MRRLALPLAFIAASLTSACYSNASRFNKDYAKRTCNWQFECARALAELAYGDYDDCVDDTRNELDDDSDDCEYDPDAARDCMAWVKDNEFDCSIDLAEFSQKCSDVYTDCNRNRSADTDGAMMSEAELE